MSDDEKTNGKMSMKVFISYAREDIEIARKLRADIEKAGIKTWLDKEDLLPGQKWRTVIRKEIRECSHFLALLSSKSLSTRGFVQKELKMALDMLGEFPDDEIFVIPVRIEECEPEDEQLQEIHWADLFPSYEKGLQDILRVLAQGRQNIPDSPQINKDVPKKEETVRNEVPPLKTEASEEKSLPESENKRSISAGDAEKSVLVSGDGNVINIIHQYEPEHKKVEQNEVPKPDKPVIEDRLNQQEAEKPEISFSYYQRNRKQKAQTLRITSLIAVIVVLLIVIPTKFDISGKLKPKYNLRSNAIKVSDEEAKSKFKLDDKWQPLEYVKNDFKDNGNGTITDHATGLMWQKLGSDKELTYENVKTYIDDLNHQNFAGYSDWRLPTIDELQSLISKEKQSKDLYISAIFEKKIITGSGVRIFVNLAGLGLSIFTSVMCIGIILILVTMSVRFASDNDMEHSVIRVI